MIDVIWLFVGLHVVLLSVMSAHAWHVLDYPLRTVLTIATVWQVLYSAVIVTLNWYGVDWQQYTLYYLGFTSAVGGVTLTILDIVGMRKRVQTYQFGIETPMCYSEVPETIEDVVVVSEKFLEMQRQSKTQS